jgi:hypothetical protein
MINLTDFLNVVASAEDGRGSAPPTGQGSP